MMRFIQMVGNEPGTATVTFKGTAYPFTNNFERKQNFGEAESGKIWVFDRGVENRYVGIKLTNLKSNEHEQLEQFIRYIARYRLNAFYFEENGITSRLVVRYWGNKYVRNMVNFNLYNMDFMLRVEI